MTKPRRPRLRAASHVPEIVQRLIDGRPIERTVEHHQELVCIVYFDYNKFPPKVAERAQATLREWSAWWLAEGWRERARP
jgi:hypothetical protein